MATCACLLLVGLGGCARRAVTVRHYGQMHRVLGGGAPATKADVTLAEAMERPHAYAVGALPGLEGEITIELRRTAADVSA